MRFKSVEILNFRQYKELKFDFKKNGEHDLHVIVGQNGLGKTNILNAITWCLYGIEPHLGDESKSLPRLNLDAKDEAQMNGEKTATVEVKIYAEDNGQVITYQRRLPVTVSSLFEQREVFSVLVPNRKGDTEVFEDDEAKAYVDKYMPEKIREYFYFDNEQLDNYFISDQSTKIKEAVHAISQVDMLTRISDRLGKQIDKKQREAGRKSPDISENNDEITIYKKQIDNSEKDIRDLKMQIESSKKIITTNTEHLRGQDNLPDLEDRYQQLTTKLNYHEQELIATNNKIFKFIKEFKIILSFYPSVKKTVEIIEEKKVNNALPPDIDKKLLINMLKLKKCLVCNRDLQSEDEQRVTDLLEKIQVSSETSHLLLEIKSELERILEKGKNYKTLKKELLKTKKQNQADIDNTGRELQQTDNEISRFTDKEQVIRWHNERKEHSELLEINIQKLGVANQQLNDSLTRLETAENKLSRAMSQLSECRKINQQVTFMKDSKIIIDRIEGKMMNEVKENMERMTMQYFDELVWKKNTYDKIKLDDNYQLDLYHKDGYSCLGSCSAAERSLLALSFTLALHEVSGFNSLLFIDTPVARVSDQNRINFANVLSDASKRKQIIMTFTPDEYSEDIRKVFEGSASTNVRLRTDDEKFTLLN